MHRPDADATRHELIQAGIDLFRRNGIAATSVADICAKAGVTKGAFFHHFATKEELIEVCLAQWSSFAREMEAAAGFRELPDPVARVLGYMDFFLRIFDDPSVAASCLAGVTAQEVSDSHPRLRVAANACFADAKARLQALLEDAGRAAGRPIDAASLATLWLATVQGALLLSKASGDRSLLRKPLEHVRRYVAGVLGSSVLDLQENPP